MSVSASASRVSPGDTTTLTISETNTGSSGAPALVTPYVELDDGLTIEILDKNSASYVDGDLDGDNELDTDETWTWQVERTVITDTTYTATGHGIWRTCTDQDVTDRDSVTVQVIPEECVECEGKVTQLTLRYDGGDAAVIRVEQKGKNGGTVFEELVQPGGGVDYQAVSPKADFLVRARLARDPGYFVLRLLSKAPTGDCPLSDAVPAPKPAQVPSLMWEMQAHRTLATVDRIQQYIMG